MKRITPIELGSTVRLTGKEWIVTDPHGRWRTWSCTFVGDERVSERVICVGDEGDDQFEFVIPLSSRRSLLWIQQEKDQFMIREYEYMAYEKMRKETKK